MTLLAGCVQTSESIVPHVHVSVVQAVFLQQLQASQRCGTESYRQTLIQRRREVNHTVQLEEVVVCNNEIINNVSSLISLLCQLSILVTTSHNCIKQHVFA